MKRFLFVISVFLMVLATTGCSRRTTAPIVAPVLHDTTFIYRTDTVRQMDSTIIEKETIIREADSATLAKLGIQLKDNERAIMVLQRELAERNRELSEKMVDTVYSSKEIPVDRPVPGEVVKPMSWLNKTLRNIGILALLAVIIYIGIRVWRRRL